MKALLISLALLLSAGAATAQNTTVSATVTDAGTQAWIAGTVTFQFVPGPGGATRAPILVALDGSGAFSHAIPSNALISPANSKYIVTVCPKANPAPCFATAPLTISGSSQSLTSTLVPPAVTVNASVNNQPSAYIDAEIAGPTIGFTYYNIIGATVRVYDGSAFADVGGGGGGGTVTNTGTLTAGALIVGNGTTDVKADPTFGIGPIAAKTLGARDDDAAIELDSTDGTTTQSYWTTQEFAFDNNDSGRSLHVLSDSGLVQLVSMDLDLSQAGTAGTNSDIIDSTGSHGTAGQVMTSLGPNNGILWVTKDGTGAIVASSLAGGTPGAGYAVGDTGTFDGGNNDATYVINSVDGSGLVLTYTIDSPGTGYEVGFTSSTPGGSQPGAGSGFGVQILAIS